MDAIRARLDVLSPETSEDTSTTLSRPKAILDGALAKKLLQESTEFSDYLQGRSTVGSAEPAIALPKDSALCIEFERTVEDESLWQSSFSSSSAAGSSTGSDGLQSQKVGRKGKEVLLIWPEIDALSVRPVLRLHIRLCWGYERRSSRLILQIPS